MFVDKADIDSTAYLVLLYVLTATESAGYAVRSEDALTHLKTMADSREIALAADALAARGLIQLIGADEKSAWTFEETQSIALTYSGLAFLVNYANEYVEAVKNDFPDIPDGFIASLVPLLELSRVPAADRYVRTTDNLPEFQRLIRELETIRDEIARDENKNELPIPEKRAVVADLDGMIAQLKKGYVKVSDLTTRIGPLVHSVAEFCKDVAIIAGACSAAYLAISAIIKGL